MIVVKKNIVVKTQIALVVMPLCALAGTAARCAQQQDLNATYEAAKQAVVKGKTAESIKLFEQSLKLADAKKDLQKQILIRTSLAAQYDSAGRFAEAETLFSQAIKLATGTMQERGIARLYQMKVRHYLLQNSATQAAAALDHAIKLGGERSKDPDYGDFLALAANVYEDKGDIKKALEYYKKSESWLMTTPADAERARSLSSCLTNMSICYSDLKEYDEAEKLLKRALQIGEEAFGKDFQGLYTTHNSLGILYSHRNQHAKAVEEYDKSLAILAKSGVTSGDLVTRIKDNRAISAAKI